MKKNEYRITFQPRGNMVGFIEDLVELRETNKSEVVRFLLRKAQAHVLHEQAIEEGDLDYMSHISGQ